MVHPRAGKKVKQKDWLPLRQTVEAYMLLRPNYEEESQRVSFGTSGHRGIPMEFSFNEQHVAAITQAICDVRAQFGATGPVFVGHDTHILSEKALDTVVRVLAANGLTVYIDEERKFVPTPSISRAILRYNSDEAHADALADGIILTPSHNPPEHGGIKYNPTYGGPADTSITKVIEERANQYLKEKKGVLISEFEAPVTLIPKDLLKKANILLYPYKRLYVEELNQIINMDVIREKGINVLVDALGGSGGHYWEAIRDYYNLPLNVVNSAYDPQFKFMPYDHDGVVRMDCSSPYAMAEVVRKIGAYDLAVGNDPDYDRYGIVTKDGMVPTNHFIAMAVSYLFETRQWAGKGIGKTAVVTDLVDRYSKDQGMKVYEVPVGFKYFSPLLHKGIIGIGAEESAGASFLQKDGTVWTTDKDGIIMALLAMEIRSTKGSLGDFYESLAAQYGHMYFDRLDVACSLEIKKALKSLDAKDIDITELDGKAVQSICTTSPYENLPIDGVKVRTESGWFVARPSGTEALYKIYAESYDFKESLEALMEEGKKVVASL